MGEKVIMDILLTITNSYEPKTISVTVTKTWNDAKDQDGKRGKVGATAILLANGADAGQVTQAVGTADGWKYTWENVPVYANGQAVVYTVNETMATTSEYTFEGSTSFTAAENTNGTITITNIKITKNTLILFPPLLLLLHH